MAPQIFILVHALIQTRKKKQQKKSYLQWWQFYILTVKQHNMATTRARRILQSDENIPFNESHRSLGSREGLSKLFLASLGAVEKICGKQKPCKYWCKCMSKMIDGKSWYSHAQPIFPPPVYKLSHSNTAQKPDRSCHWKQTTEAKNIQNNWQ